MQPEFIATKSAWRAITPLRIFLFLLLFILIIPPIVILIMIICQIIKLKHDKIEFYQNKVIQRSGVFSRNERESMFQGIISISIDQSVWGRICKYGDVKVDVVGKWDIDTQNVKNPQALVEYLRTRIVEGNAMATTIIA